MKKCNKCQVKIIDGSLSCPLCKSVLCGDKEAVTDYSYPQAAFSSSSYYLLNKILLFIALLVIITSIVVNYLLYNGVLWAIASISAVFYIWISIRHAIRNSIDLASKIILQAVMGCALVFIIDLVIGFSGWSVNYLIPQLVTLANIGILVLLIVSRLEWKKYVIHQIGMSIIGWIPILLLVLHIVTRPLMTYIAAGTSVVILLFTVIFGDKSLKSEIIRRFHI